MNSLMFGRTATVLLVLMAAPSLYSQVVSQPVPPRDPEPSRRKPLPVGTGAISGVVSMAGSSQPARKVRVNLSGSELRGSRSTTTDDQGRFSFTALPAGRYTLGANKPGHVSVSYNQRRPGTPGTAIQLSDGQKFEAHLQIPRGSVLTGTVLDENGEATPGTNVRAMRVVNQGGRRTLQARAAARPTTAASTGSTASSQATTSSVRRRGTRPRWTWNDPSPSCKRYPPRSPPSEAQADAANSCR